MEYDYSTSKPQPAGCFGNANIAGPPRTLDRLGDIVSRLKGVRRTVDSMLDRCSASPRQTAVSANGQSLGNQLYTISIDDAVDELNAIDDLLAALATHV